MIQAIGYFFPALCVVGFGSFVLGIIVGVILTGSDAYKGGHERG